jgi:3-oxoacyl-(acyl-carrier-protein) synthase
MIGHCLSAAGSISIAAVLQLHQGFIFQILIAKT